MYTEPEIPQAKPRPFVTPTRGEALFGLAYLILHMFFMGPAIGLFANLFGLSLSIIALNLLYFLTGSLVLTLGMRQYLMASFDRFRAYGIRNLKAFGLGCVIRYGSAIPLTMILLLFLPEFSTTPNNEAVRAMAYDHLFPTAFLAIVLAPIVEELLFRGALYGGLRNRNRIAAYVVSALLFAFLHVLSFLLFLPTVSLLLMMLLYVPAGVALAYAYEKSGSIWTAIFLHAGMNFLAIALNVTLF